MSEFAECRKRVARAQAHGQAAADIWNDLFEDNPYTTSAEMEDEGIGVARVVFSKPIGDGIDIALELGEMFYQLRAALDGATFQYATLLCTPNPPTDECNLYFPVTKSPKSFKNSTFNANPFPQELKDWIDSIQPHNIGKLTNPTQLQLARLIRLLNTCAKNDRHRRLHVAGVFPGTMTGHFELMDSTRVTFQEAIHCDFFKGESKVLRFGLDGRLGDKLKIDFKFTPEIRIEGIANASPWEALDALINSTTYVIDRFEMVQSGKPLIL